MNFIVVMRRFLNPEDRIYYKVVWEQLQSEFPEELSNTLKSNVNAFILELNKGDFTIEYNNELLTAGRIYQILAEGERFNRLQEYADYLKGIADVPITGPIFWREFYEYSKGALLLTSKIYDVICKIERTEKYVALYGEPSTISNQCIYCLSSEGSFKSEEHMVPEGMGNYDDVLPRGYVCDSCNNGPLSILDNALCECPLFVFQRVKYVPYTKQGKLPEFRFQNATLRKTDPLNITFIADPDSDAVEVVKEHEDGTVELNVRMTYRKLFNERLLARALCKIALGTIAIDLGRDYACSSRFDATRKFIREGGEFHNNLLLLTWFTDRPEIQLRYFHDLPEGTLAEFLIFGVYLCLNLEEAPLLELSEELRQAGYIELPLFGTTEAPEFQMQWVKPPTQAA
ncbi:MAG TPA: hypothetical protein VGE04_12850 [Chloroflexia bacterium]|jgi:hypothetical protein